MTGADPGATPVSKMHLGVADRQDVLQRQWSCAPLQLRIDMEDAFAVRQQQSSLHVAPGTVRGQRTSKLIACQRREHGAVGRIAHLKCLQPDRNVAHVLRMQLVADGIAMIRSIDVRSELLSSRTSGWPACADSAPAIATAMANGLNMRSEGQRKSRRIRRPCEGDVPVRDAVLIDRGRASRRACQFGRRIWKSAAQLTS